MDSIKKVSIGEIKANKEELLNSMKGLVHTAKDIFGSIPFKDEDISVGTAHILIIEVDGNKYPVYYTPNTMAMIDGDLSITDYIFDEENYLSLSSDDDMMWFSLVMQLGHQIELLQNENNQYSDDFVNANEEIDKLNCKLAEEIKARQGYEESLKQLRDELNAANNEINELEEDRKETNKKCSEYVKEIDKLSIDNKRLSERVKTLVIEKSKLEKSDDDRTEKPASEIIKECVGDKVDLETATLLLQENAKLKEEVQSLKDYLRERISEYDRRLSVFKREKEEAELMAYRLTKGEMLVQFDNMKSLEHENGVLKDENADLNQKLWQNGYHITYSAHSAHSEEADVDNEDMQQTITQETMAELTAKIKELVSKLKDKDERINQLSKNNAALSAENKNLNEMIKNADRDARFYAREVDHLRQENDKIYSILNDAVKVVQDRNKQE